MKAFENTDAINLAFVPEFYLNEDDIILFAGTQEPLMKFSNILEEYSYGVLNEDGFQNLCKSWGEIKLTLEVSEFEKGMHHIGSNELIFAWTISKERMKQFVTLIREVANSNEPSHHYLDCDDLDEVTVMVSKGEYDVHFFEKLNQ